MHRTNLPIKLFLLTFLISYLSLSAVIAQTTRGAGNAPKKPATTTTAAVEEKISSNNTKKTVVVLDFDDASLSERKIQVGRQAALFLSNKFGETGKYTVVERQRILQILDEQNISQNADRYDAKLASKIGKVFSASAVVLGTVTEYTVKKSTKGLPGFKKVTISAKIGLVIRLVDVNTGVVLDSVTIDGNADESSTATIWSEQATEENEDLRIRLFTAAANNAVTKAIGQLEPTIAKVPESKPTSTGTRNADIVETKTEPAKPSANSSGGKIAQVAGSQIYISGISGVAVGTKLNVNRIGREIKDPDTGEVLDVESTKVGVIEVTEVRAKIIIAKIVSGTGFKVKDIVNTVE